MESTAGLHTLAQFAFHGTKKENQPARLFLIEGRSLYGSSALPLGDRLPTIQCTGFVKDVPVLLTGTLRKHRASSGGAELSAGSISSSSRQRIQPMRSRRISSVRRPAKHQATTTARISSNG